MPQNQEEWLSIAENDENTWNFPHCLGAIDGKHGQLQAPIASGSDYFNYKSTFSIVLMAVVDADYNFLYANVGSQGRISDGGVFRNTSFFKKLEDNGLVLPPAQNLNGRENAVPYVFVADDAFPLKENILKPYSGSHEKHSTKRIFNYRLSRARRVVENVFGILSAVFRVFRKPMLLEPQKAELVVMACVYLHNYLRKNKSSRDIYSPTDLFDREIEGNRIVDRTWRQEINSFQPLGRVGRRAPRIAEEIRNEFAEYFSSSGALSWQSNVA